MEEKSSHFLVLFIELFLFLLHSGGVSSSCDNINEIDFAEFTYEPESLAPHPDVTVALIECGVLYQIVPPAFERTTCTNGSWTGPLPRCRHVPRNCRRHEGLVQIYGRDCQTQCKNCLEGACTGDRRCHCDGVCGWSCIPISIQCRPLETPPHALPGPCSPPYNTGKMCTYSCMAGYTKIGGDDRRICDEHGEWIGSPICCGQDARNRTVPSCNSELVFLEEPQNLEVANGDLFQPGCRVSDQDATLKWFKDGQRLDSGAVDGIFINHLNQLIIPSFDERHAGNYSCVVYSGDMECIRSEASITFDFRSYFEFVPVNAYVNISDDHQFLCSPKEKTWSVIWEKDGRPLEQGNLLILGGNLYLTDIRNENAGKYTCVARDQFKRTKGRVHAWLYLTDPPQIDITTVCGTITYWKESKSQTTPSPAQVIAAQPEAAGSSIDWSSEDINEAVSGRVVGGIIANHGSAPYMVRIWEYRPDNAWESWIFICGATLLDQRWILTAAHCMFDKNKNFIKRENMNLFFGDHDSNVREESEKSRQPAEIIVHEDYDKTNHDNDIALIRIDPPLWEFTPYIRPICLAPWGLASRLMETSINERTTGRVTGWGQETLSGPTNRFMKEVGLPIVDRHTCEESVHEKEGEFTDNMFCAGYHSPLRDACQGDSGGPFAFRHDDGRWYQLGIVSWGVGCDKEGEYGFYTSVSRYLHWLRSKNVTVAYSPNVERRFNESRRSEALAFTERSPSILTVAAGSVVNLECVPNRDDASVQWFIGNSIRPVRNLVEGVRILPSGLVFHFDAVEDRFFGVYSCEARVNDEEGEQVIRANFQLQSTEPPHGHGSCSNSCCTSTEYSCNPEGCYCDSECESNDNCCDDYEDVCPNLESRRDVFISNTTYNMRGGELLRVFTPNYPNNYNNLENILWHVRGVHGRQFLITFMEVRMHSIRDYARIHTGFSDVFEESTQIFHLTYNLSSDLPDHYWSVHPNIWLQFSTNTFGTDQGLFVMINAVSVGDCDEIFFQCTNGQCIYSSAACNGLSDCVDSSDEYQCKSTEPPHRHGSCSNSCCTSSEYSCNPEGCYCDSECESNSNCCDDYEDVCPNLDSMRDVFISNTTYNMRGGERLRLFTPNYPNNYNNLESILWHVRGVHGRQFLITFGKVRMHSIRDYARIHTGISDVFEESTQIFHLTYNHSSDLPDHYWSVHPNIWLQFSTDSLGTDQGLFVMINAVSVGDCDGIFFQCTNGQCIYSSAACNGLSDCVDSSDEYQCDPAPPPPPPPPSVFPPSGTYRVPPNSVFEIIYGTMENGEPSIIYNGTEITDTNPFTDSVSSFISAFSINNNNEEAYRLLKNESLDCTRSLVHLMILILDDTYVTFTKSNLKYLIEPYDMYTKNEAVQRCEVWEDASDVYSSLNEETAWRNERHVKNYIPDPWNQRRPSRVPFLPRKLTVCIFCVGAS